MRNHSATYLLHSALRNVLGSHVAQQGSLVGPDRLRFDFTHHKSLTDLEIYEIELFINHEIQMNHPVHAEIMELESAKNSGAIALFGEKYGNEV